jgi:hypothetical protein
MFDAKAVFSPRMPNIGPYLGHGLTTIRNSPCQFIYLSDSRDARNLSTDTVATKWAVIRKASAFKTPTKPIDGIIQWESCER